MADDARRDAGPPAVFFTEHAAALRESADAGPLLDLACGRGRHAIAAADLGLEVTAVDRNREALDALAGVTPERGGRIETLEADLETGPPPLAPGGFGAVLVFRYLHRPLAPWIEGLLAPGGLLLYETFTVAQRELGWGPSRDAFLLRAGELPGLFPGLEVECFEEGPSRDAKPAYTARLRARRAG